MHTFKLPPATPQFSFQPPYVGTRNQHLSSASSQPASYPGPGPRRGSFPDLLPHGHTSPPPINQAIANLRAGVFDPATVGMPESNDVQTDSDPDFRYSTPSSRMDPPPRSDGNAEPADDSVISVVHQSNTAGTDENVKISNTATIGSAGSRRNKQYVLADGSVVSGKGLGRGRPGIKRGPKSQNPQSADESSSKVLSATDVNASTPSTGRPSKKRKSIASDTSVLRASTLDTDESASRESSEEYNPTAHTRSGRQTQKPDLHTSASVASASPSARLSRTNSAVNGASNSPAVKTHPKIKRRVYRGREQFALCEHCLRGYGPPGNVIVFCDACNKCWHQRCHEPHISKQTVTDSKAEWYCSECDRILHGKKKDKKANGKTSIQPALAAPPVAVQAPTYAGPRLGGRFIPRDQKVGYLKTLSKEDLVSLLLQSSDLAPDLPLFQALVPPPPPPVAMPQAQFTSTYVTPVSKMPSFRGKDLGDDDEVDEGYDGYFDEHAALYPKPGHGLQLPPERDDLHMLLEGKESRTFSHWIRSMPGNLFSGTGDITSTTS